ncbi:MAG: tRNA dimethylallyltransferase [Acidimicrobiales bacterium]|jgi:tRNA dimethylallyltransferase|nr:tRNA dimethylallyltransferase [Acidimicrobiales bacterium]
MRHLALVGPTASGKSALAMELARRLPGPPIEIVTVDSMQVYRGMDIGTAKPSAAERADVPHHLLDIAEADEDFNVSCFQRAALDAIDDIARRGRRALLVGGTGLYYQAVVDQLTLPGQYPDVLAQLDAEPDTAALHRRLGELDPVAAGRMEPANRRRVLRALEVTVGSGRPFSDHGPGLAAFPANGRFAIAGVWLPRATIRARIVVRYEQQVRDGFLDEVRRLTNLSRTAAEALGYRELRAHLDGRTSLDEAMAAATQRTAAFARRQRVWFRRDPRITWFGAAENPFAALPALLGHWSAA